MALESSVETLLRQAIERGEFENLPGSGKPLDLGAYFDTPEELRMTYAILKNAGILPEEASLLKEIATLREELTACREPARADEVQQRMNKLLLKLNLLIDQRPRR